MVQEVKKAVCEACHCWCRVLVYSENGRLLKIEEDRSDPRVDSISPRTRGCRRLLAAGEIMYHPSRVNYPLKRVCGRGEGNWQRIPWGQAFDEIAERLQRVKGVYGAEATALITGTARTTYHPMVRFMNLLGSPNCICQGEICYGPYNAVGAAMFGWVPASGLAAGRYGGITKSILLIGIAPSESRQRAWKTVRDVKASGGKIIVIDPRRTRATDEADIWLQLRPGSDAALLMAMINVVIEERLYDKEFVENWCYGFDKLVERAREYSPEKAAGITWVPAEKIREAARMYARNRPGLPIRGMGVDQSQNSIEELQAIFILAAITGNLDVEGGSNIPGPAPFIREPEMELNEMLPAVQKAKQLGANQFKLQALPGFDLINENLGKVWGKVAYATGGTQAIAHAPTVYRAMATNQPYPVKAAITIAANPMVTQANVKLVFKSLMSLDTHVILDYWMTPTAELADYVLPVAMWIERPYLSSGLGTYNGIIGGEQALPAVIPGEYEHKTDYDILRELGIRLGQEGFWPWETLEESFDYQLEPLGLTHLEFMAKGGFYYPPPEYKKYEKTGFATATGKAELYSTVFEKLGYDPLPQFEEPAETPISNTQLAKEYPLMLITGGRFLPMYHSEHRQVDSLRRQHPHPLVQINPETATQLGLNDGDWAWIESPRGRIRMKCQHYSGIDPRVVHCEHGWWFPELPGEEPWLHGVWESNVNILTADDPDRCNKLNGGWPLKTALCKIYKCKTY